MQSRDLISFRLWGDYALFKKPWCNREQQSFLIPTKTSLLGMIGGILGFDKEEYLHRLPAEEVKVGIQLRKKIGKEMHGYNFMQSANLKSRTKNFSNPYRNPSGKGMRSPTRLEMLKDPDYKVFIYLKQQTLRENLYGYLKREECVFPPFLGQVNFFANIDRVTKKGFMPKKLESVSTVAPADTVKPLRLRGKVYRERIPVRMQIDRSMPEFLPVVFKNNKRGQIPVTGSDHFLIGKTEDGQQISLF